MFSKLVLLLLCSSAAFHFHRLHGNILSTVLFGFIWFQWPKPKSVVKNLIQMALVKSFLAMLSMTFASYSLILCKHFFSLFEGKLSSGVGLAT